MKLAAETCLAVVAVLAMTATGALAQYHEDFDSYPPGSQIVDQADWLLWADDATDASNGGALVSGTISSSPGNSLQISGVDAVPGLNSDVVWQFGPITSGVWTFTANVYIPNDADLGEQDLCWMAVHPGDPPGTGIDWIGGPIMAFHLDTGLIDAGPAQFARGVWKEVKIVTDVDNLTYDTFYDGAPLVVGGTWDGPNQVEALDLWANNGGTGCSPIYYDDLSMVPEPTTVVMLLGLGFGALVRRRRR